MVNEIKKMTDQHRLQNKLAKLGSSEAGQDARGRIIEAAPDASLLQAVLCEIDETILARLLCLENNLGLTLKLEVTSRRLLRLVDLTGFENASRYKVLIDRAISAEDDAERQEFAALVQDFTTGAETVFVQTEKLTRDVDAAEVGISVEALAVICGVDLYGVQTSGDPMTPQEFLSICQEKAVAWVRLNGMDAVDTSGENEHVKSLIGLSNTDLTLFNKRLDGCFDGESTPCSVVFGSDMAPENLVMYLRQPDGDWFFLFNSSDATELVSNWHG